MHSKIQPKMNTNSYLQRSKTAIILRAFNNPQLINLILIYFICSLFLQASATDGTGPKCQDLVLSDPNFDGPFKSANELIKFLDRPSNKKLQILFKPNPNFHHFDPNPVVSVKNYNFGADELGYSALSTRWIHWGSSHKKKFDPDGDPLWIVHILGDKLAAFFGFRLLDESTLIVPNATLFNQRIAKLNAQLTKMNFETIPVNWIQASIINDSYLSKLSYAENYVRSFASNHNLPWSRSNIIHDTAFHSLSILISKKQSLPITARMQTAIDLADYIRNFFDEKSNRKKNQFDLLSRKEIRECLLEIFFIMLSSDIDNFSGLIPINILKYNERLNTFNTNQKHDPYYLVIRSAIGRQFNDPQKLAQGIFELPTIRSKYTLISWLKSTVNYLQAYFSTNFKLDNNETQGFIDIFLPAIKIAQSHYPEAYSDASNNLEQLFEEFKTLVNSFIRERRIYVQTSLPLNTVLAIFSFDKNGQIVVSDGIASAEVPEVAAIRRIDEMKKALHNLRRRVPRNP
ncbi:MAG: hypothetical protein K1X29_04550 [Bdellovibrionales bacterium]|nr:hypothetical protein [Bdellovibrionales bacterium]